jgi:Na+/pantothenate symporter
MTGIIIILIPLLIYVIGALSVRRKGLTHPDDFFVAYKKVGETAFSSSSIAYAFQVSTIYPFLLWGASKFYFVPLVNTVCWGFGIFLFYLSYNKYKHFVGKDLTLHGFLGERYGSSVRVIASYLTIIAFLGFAISETYFGSKVLLSIVDNRIIFYGIIIFSLLFVYGYIAYGGQVSSIRTDQLQLIISYIGVFGLFIYLIYLIIANGINISSTLSVGLLILSIYIIAIFIFRKLKFIKFSEHDTTINKFLNKGLNTLVIVFFSAVAVLSIYAFFTSNVLADNSDFHFFNVEGFGIAGLLSLIVLPLSFQFVDLSNWQRLLSVKPDNSINASGLNKNIRKGLLTYAVESPFTWLIFVFFGLLAITALPNFTFQDLLIDIPKQLINSNSILQEILGYTFIVSILAIMLSTVDSFIMGIIFTFVYDSNYATRKLLDEKNSEKIKSNYLSITNKGRLFGLLAIIIGLTFFIFFDQNVKNGGEMFINLLLAFYSAQISFFPLIFGLLFLKKQPSQFWANLSMILGALSGVSIGVYAVLYNSEWAWYPILVCFILSTITYCVGYILSYKNSELK